MGFLDSLFGKKKKISPEMKEVMAINEKLNTMEVDMAELKTFSSQLDNDLTQSIKPLRDEVRDIKESLKLVHGKVKLFDGAIHENVAAEIDGISRMKLFNSSVSEFHEELDRVSKELDKINSDIVRLDKKEIPIQYDSKIEELKNDLEKFKKVALTVDDKM